MLIVILHTVVVTHRAMQESGHVHGGLPLTHNGVHVAGTPITNAKFLTRLRNTKEALICMHTFAHAATDSHIPLLAEEHLLGDFHEMERFDQPESTVSGDVMILVPTTW